MQIFLQFVNFNINDLSLRVILLFLVVLQLPEHVFILCIPPLVILLLSIQKSFVFTLKQMVSSIGYCGLCPECTLRRLFSRWSSLQSFSSFSRKDTLLLSSARPWSFSFCNWSPLFLFLRLSRSNRFISAKRSLQRFWRASIFCKSSSFEVWLSSSRRAFLTSRSVKAGF